METKSYLVLQALSACQFISFNGLGLDERVLPRKRVTETPGDSTARVLEKREREKKG